MVDPSSAQISLLVTFFSVSAALYTQKLLAARGLRCKVVPVPRTISSSCGYALEALGLPTDALAELLGQTNAEWAELYQQVTHGKSERYELAIVNPKEVQDNV